MRKSILLSVIIFAFIGVFGQVITGNYSYAPGMNCNTNSNKYANYNRTVNDDIAIEKALITLLKMYKTECYNDSTLIDVYIDPNIKVTLDDRNIGYSNLLMGYYEKKWVHKEPTFADFINWLEK